MEEWKDVVGFEGIYQVSSTGIVRRTDNNYIKKPSESRNGYMFVDLNHKEKRKHGYIHRLVAEAFIPNPNNLPAVNHKDENKTNNNVDNLEWCTYKYNNNYGGKWLLKKHPERDTEIKTMRAQGYSIREIAAKYNLSHNTVRGILSRDFTEEQSLINHELRQLMIRNNLSQKEIAEQLGVSSALIASWLNSKMKLDNIGLILKAINEIGTLKQGEP